MFYGEQKILSMLKPQFCYLFRIIILFSEQSKQLHTTTPTMKLATLASAAAVLLSAFAGTVSASVSSTLHVVCCVLTDGDGMRDAVFFFLCMLMLMLLLWCRVHPCSDCVWCSTFLSLLSISLHATTLLYTTGSQGSCRRRLSRLRRELLRPWRLWWGLESIDDKWWCFSLSGRIFFRR